MDFLHQDLLAFCLLLNQLLREVLHISVEGFFDSEDVCVGLILELL